MPILINIVGATTITAVAGTALYFNCDEKTRKKLEPAYEAVKKICPYLNCPLFEKKEPTEKK